MEFISRRRKFLVNKDLQFSLLCITLGYVIFFFLVMTTSLFVPLMVDLKAADGSMSKKTLESAQNFLFLHNNFWLPSVLCLISISIHSIRTSHRIAGPIYRLNTVVDSIKQGIIPPPMRTLRKGDYLVKEFSNISDMVDHLSLTINNIHEAHAALDKTILQCTSIPASASQHEIMKAMNEIAAKSDTLRDTIKSISIQNDDIPSGPSPVGGEASAGTCGCKQEQGAPESKC